MNDARYFDWPEGLRRYIDDIRQGKGQNPKQYSARYICSLVADFHRSVCPFLPTCVFRVSTFDVILVRPVLNSIPLQRT